MKTHNWKELHRWERKEKANALKKLTLQDGFRALEDLYQLFLGTKGNKELLKLNVRKISLLSKVHFSLGKVKLR